MFGDPKDINEFKETSGYTIDGLWYPRVTKIVTIKAKPALYYYYGEAKSYRAANEATELSALEGTLIHEVAEAILLGKDPEIPDGVKGAIGSFKEFLAKTPVSVEPENVERRIVNRDHRYAGTVDAIATIGGKLGVLDIKTSASIYRDYCLQTSAYMDALKDEFPTLETRWILRIDQLQKCVKCGAIRRLKGGNEKIKIDWRNSLMKTCMHEWSEFYGDIELKEFPSWQNDFQAFLAAKRLWEWENEEWLKKIAYL
jgi:hypothetical protein